MVKTTLVKGSPEAKARMAYLRSLRKKKKGGSLIGSIASGIGKLTFKTWKRWIDELREQKKRIKELEELKKSQGSGIVGKYPTLSEQNTKLLQFLQNSPLINAPPKKPYNPWRIQASASKGGKMEGRDWVDVLAGPWGWLALGMRKKREKEIERLEKETGSR